LLRDRNTTFHLTDSLKPKGLDHLFEHDLDVRDPQAFTQWERIKTELARAKKRIPAEHREVNYTLDGGT
jgi:hypothetical protein